MYIMSVSDSNTSVSVSDSNISDSNTSVSDSNTSVSDSNTSVSVSVSDSNTAISDKVDLIMRQTDYNKTTAEEKLSEYKDDAMQVIRAYLNGGKINKPCVTRLSVNQQIYKEIRGMMDDAAINYQLKKEKEAKESAEALKSAEAAQ